jgi:glycosyltransferase involved in cell wall biosynthesis
MYQALNSNHEVYWPGPIKLSKTDNRILWAWHKWQEFNKKKYTAHFILNARILAKSIRKMFHDEDFDCIVVGAGEPELIAYLETSLPIIYVADTTFANMVDYYPWHTGLCNIAIREGNKIEQMAINRAFHIIYSSEWAANSAISDYGAPKDKISVAPFGDSLKTVPAKFEAENDRQSDTCRLLFVATNWVRKGGPLAVTIFNLLKEMGIKCTLTIVGSNPILENSEGILVIPYLDKEKEEDTQLLDRLYRTNDLLLLPTRADCTPVVFSEAAAFGLPVITTDTGGTSSVIREGENGFCLPLSSGAKAYADLIKQIWENKEELNRLRFKSRENYEKRLNWIIWQQHFDNITAKLSLL